MNYSTLMVVFAYLPVFEWFHDLDHSSNNSLFSSFLFTNKTCLEVNQQYSLILFDTVFATHTNRIQISSVQEVRFTLFIPTIKFMFIQNLKKCSKTSHTSAGISIRVPCRAEKSAIQFKFNQAENRLKFYTYEVIQQSSLCTNRAQKSTYNILV